MKLQEDLAKLSARAKLLCFTKLANNNLVNVDFTSYLTPSVSQTRGHHFKFR